MTMAPPLAARLDVPLHMASTELTWAEVYDATEMIFDRSIEMDKSKGIMMQCCTQRYKRQFSRYKLDRMHVRVT